MTKKQKKVRNRILIVLALFVILLICDKTGLFDKTPELVRFVLYLIPYIIIGYDVIRKAAINISHGQVFDENFLMMIATFGAFGIREYSEALAVMLFYQVGELFQSYAVGKSRQSITEMMSIAPEFANIVSDDGQVKEVDPEEVSIGDVLLIRAGEKIPVDAEVVEGDSFIDTAALTGESVPRRVALGDQVISGCVNGEGVLKVRATKVYEDSTVAKILELVENASNKKSRMENFITRFARVYTPAVVIAAVILAFIPPLISGNFVAEFGKWVLRACTFLVISCPCALVISVPLAFFGGIGAASSKGVLVKGSNYLELLANLDTVVSDKTGTLTEGKFKVSMIEAASGYTTDEVIRLAAAVEAGSTHPIARAIVEACDNPISQSKVKDETTVAGKGVKAKVGKHDIAAGNYSFLEAESVTFDDKDKSLLGANVTGTMIYVAEDGKYIGTIVVSDVIKAGAKEAIAEMIQKGVRRFVMLTGDSSSVAYEVASELGISEYRAELLPPDKVHAVEELLNEQSGSLAFIGDGINDAPVLSRADVGIAMGSLGSDAAIEAADVVIMDDDLAKIPAVMSIAAKTLGISRQNIVFALFVKFACLVLGAIGIANMWIAVFADVGVAVLCILNSMRMLAKK